MAKKVSLEQLRKYKSDVRYTELPQPCLHCKNILTVGSQFDEEGWTCRAFPNGILYGILAQHDPHTQPFISQEGEYVYDPVIYTEEDTGRRWHYTADAGWKYVDEESSAESD